jgi:hypothetical protein
MWPCLKIKGSSLLLPLRVAAIPRIPLHCFSSGMSYPIPWILKPSEASQGDGSIPPGRIRVEAADITLSI